jgi:hypothetical protein
MKLLKLSLAAALAFAPSLALANSTTTNLGLNKPTVGADADAWGAYLNTNSDTLDALFATGPALLVTKGGTGATTASAARTSLGLTYASGSFTPTPSFATAGTSSFAYTTQTGAYVCSAPGVVTVGVQLVFTPTIGTGSGTLLVGGLPYAMTGGPWSGSVGSMAGAWTGWTGQAVVAFNDSTHVRVNYFAGPGASTSSLAQSNMTSGSAHTLVFSITYQAAGC